jgi:hypothetical protein
LGLAYNLTLMPKTLFYAQGSGLGHLQRCTHLAQTLQISQRELILASSSSYTEMVAKKNNITPLQIPTNFQYDLIAYQKWLLAQIQYHQIEQIFIDVFPCGIIGEWNNFENIAHKNNLNLTFHYLGRRLKWATYQPIARNAPQLETAYIFEELEPAHHHFITTHSNLYIDLTTTSKTTLANNPTQNYWLIIHSEPWEELQILIDYALEKYVIQEAKTNLVILTQIDKQTVEKYLQSQFTAMQLPNITILKTLETEILLHEAEKIFSACGFNLMQQTQQYAHKHEFIPFERRFDDQFWRAKQRKKY